MKKIVSMGLLILTMGVLLSACDGESEAPLATSPSNASSSAITETQGDEQAASEPEKEEIKEVLIADDDYVTATFEKIYDATSLGIDGVFYIDINVNNKTDREIWAYLDKASVNDEMVPMVMSGVPLRVKPEKSGRNSFIISFTQLSVDKVEDVKNIEFDLVIADEETLDEIERVKGISLNFD